MDFSWLNAGRTIVLLIILLKASTLPSAIRASAVKKVLEAMLRKEYFGVKKVRGSNVEYMKMDAVARSPLEQIIAGSSANSMAARLYEEELCNLLYDAMVSDWDVWLGTTKHSNDGLYYYRHYQHKLQSILLIAISRQQLNSVLTQNPRFFGWDKEMAKQIKEDDGDECKRTAFDVLYNEKLWKSHFIRISIKDVCILSFGVVAQDHIHNHAIVNHNLFSYVWPQIRFKDDNAYEIPISHDERRLMRMMLDGADAGAKARKDEHSHVSYKILHLAASSSPLKSRYKPYIPELLDEAVLRSWEDLEHTQAAMKPPALQEAVVVDTFLYYEWKDPPLMRMLITIARHFEPHINPSVLQKKESESESSTSLFHKVTLKNFPAKKKNEQTERIIQDRMREHSEKDECLDMISDELLERINAYEGYYVQFKRGKCTISYMIVACQDYSMIGPLSHNIIPYQSLPLNVINKVCPTNNLARFIQLTGSS